jgi:hypothetical protein
MLRISALAASAALLAAPAFAMDCSYGKHSASASAESYVPDYAPIAASTTIQETGPLQSTPIDSSVIVYEEDIQIETVQPIYAPEG